MYYNATVMHMLTNLISRLRGFENVHVAAIISRKPYLLAMITSYCKFQKYLICIT